MHGEAIKFKCEYILLQFALWWGYSLEENTSECWL